MAPPNGVTTFRELRNLRGFTQEGLGYVANVAHTTVGRIERGLVVPEKATAARLARALRISSRDLLALLGNDT